MTYAVRPEGETMFTYTTTALVRKLTADGSDELVVADVVNPYDEDDPFARFRFSAPIGVHRIGDELTITITREGES
jgi:hypothetical protein